MATLEHSFNVLLNPWWTIQLPISWGDEHRRIDFIHEAFNDPDTEASWLRQGFDPQRFTGDLYDMRFAEPNWIDPIRAAYPLKYWSWSIYRMTPGTILPEHRDTYARFMKTYNVKDINTIVRCVIFLEDWESGHYLEVDSTPFVSWSRGQGVCWRGDVPHLAANLGKTNRYTLQITGLE